MASAHAWSGRLDEAHRALAEARRLEPHDSVRSHYPDVLVRRHMAQIERYREGLRMAGLRDHAEETADFGVAPDRKLHATLRGFTPLTVPGATTIRTAELVRLLTARKPLVIDTFPISGGDPSRTQSDCEVSGLVATLTILCRPDCPAGCRRSREMIGTPLL